MMEDKEQERNKRDLKLIGKSKISNFYIDDSTDMRSINTDLYQANQCIPKSRIFAIHINSGGGLSDQFDCLRQTLQQIAKKRKLITVNFGQVMSSANDIFDCGEIRLCEPDARFMIHQAKAQNNEWQSLKDLQEQVAYLEKLNARDIAMLHRYDFPEKLRLRYYAAEDIYFGKDFAFDRGYVTSMLSTMDIPNLKGEI